MNDEACAAVPAEIVNGWHGDKVIPVFSGDWKQLPPAFLAYNEKWKRTEDLVSKLGDLQKRYL